MFSFDADSGELFLYGEIGPEWAGMIDASLVIEALNKMDGRHVTVRINSAGGSVDEGISLYNALKRHSGGVTTIVDSMAASMASYIMQAGETRIIANNSMVMVHDPWGVAIGNSTEFRGMADLLDKYRTRMIPDYAARTGKTDAEIEAIMTAETWYSGQEAIDAGFADKMEGKAKTKAPMQALARCARHVPESLIKQQSVDSIEFPLRAKFKSIAASL